MSRDVLPNLAAVILALVVLMCPVPGASGQSSDAEVAWEPCRLPGLDEDVRCTSYEVYEDREARTGRTIRLRIAVLPATGPEPEPDPLFILAGGPGQGSTALADFAASTLPELRRDREIVLVDQRGTGASNPLNCELPGSDRDPQSYLGDLFPVEPLRACRTELAERADLRLYTTPIAMDDLDDVREWLGYERINLYGTSYGTRAAQVYMRRHPEHVRAVVLSGVVPTRFQMPLHHARSAQRALDGLLADCVEDRTCGAAYPRLDEKFDAVLTRLQEGPVPVTIPHPASGEPVTVQLDRYAFASTLRYLMYSPGTARQIPAYLEQAYTDNDFGPFASLAVAIRRSLAGGLSVGMHLSVTCTEDLPLIREDEVEDATEGTFLGDARVRQQSRACELWPRGSLPPGYHEPVRSEVPALLIVGELDPVTPPWAAEQVARNLLNSRVVVVPGGAHSNTSDCVTGLITAFVAAGRVEGLEASCVSETEPPPFVVRSASGG